MTTPHVTETVRNGCAITAPLPPHNLTTRYFTPDPASARRAELPHRGIVAVRLALAVDHYGPRHSKTRMGIVHREV